MKIQPENFPERVVWWSIVGMYGFFVIGGVYVAGSVIGWILFGYFCKQWWLQNEETPNHERITIPWVTWIWIVGMLVMEVALVLGHLDFNLGIGLIIKSTIGWAKGWALLALFPLMGCLKIRPQLVYRAVCILCFHTLLLFPFFFLAYIAHLPQVLYVSPLKAVGGPGPYFFDVPLYEIDATTGVGRWRFFTPWAPALGFVGNIYFIFSLQEKERKWRWAGIAGSILMCIVPASRLALLSLVLVMAITWFLTNFRHPIMMMCIGIGSFVGGILSPILVISFENFVDGFKGARAASTRVRQTLGEIAVDRWWNDAPIWGHGVVEEGPHLVEYMPIGSHHSWFGLLFVKGAVGFAALAIPMIFSLLDLLIKAQDNAEAEVGLSVLIIIFLYTFGENLEILAYLFWPGLLIMGIAFRQPPGMPSENVG
ncbi:MAG: hypothetical protein VKJ46_02710 [Leptolyngbyaceae bacterium]|nr:hypothetical protein [Leptolyngbyaceae bacterium]